MFNTIQMPRAGEPLRAAWASNLAARVNELCTASAPGMLQREGLTGTGAAPIQVNLRHRRGGGSAVRTSGPFEPIFEKVDGETVLAAVGPGFIPWGRTFVFVTSPTLGQGAATAKTIGLAIRHPVDGEIQPTGTIIDFESSVSTDFQTVLPLYAISKGAISIDYRCYLALAIRE